VFGILGGSVRIEDVMHGKRTADRPFGAQYKWSVLGAGRILAIAAMAAAMGGNVRVGPDSLWSGGQTATSSAEQVRARQITRALPLGREPGRSPRNPGLKGGDRVAF
jgi:uncharacterized protein (DUF849 family)